MQKLLAASFALIVVATTTPSLWAQKFPTAAATDQFPVAAAITLDLGGTTNCAVLLTGPCIIHRSTNALVGTTNTINTEIVSLDLVGTDPTLGQVRLRAGTNFLAQASTGQITSATNVFISGTNSFAADSFFDVFAQIQVGGTNLINQTAVRLNTKIFRVPPINHTYTNLNQVALADATDTNTTVGTLVQFWLVPAAVGKGARLGFSVDVVGTNLVYGTGTSTNSYTGIDTRVCEDPNVATAIVHIKRNSFSGTLTPNAGCDELTGTNLLFAAILNTTLRAPDWRGSHKGNFIIYRLDSNGRTNLVASGQMQGSNGVGTHRTPLNANIEDCSSSSHFEGSLRGRINEKTAFSGTQIEATYAGEYVDGSGNPLSNCPPPATPPSGPFRLTIDGVGITKSCLVVQ